MCLCACTCARAHTHTHTHSWRFKFSDYHWWIIVGGERRLILRTWCSNPSSNRITWYKRLFRRKLEITCLGTKAVWFSGSCLYENLAEMINPQRDKVSWLCPHSSNLFYNFIYFLAALGLCCCTCATLWWWWVGFLLQGLLVAEHRL